MSQLIIIEGLIGAGKTTLTKQLAKELGAVPVFEPVESNPYLEKYYEDPKRYALEMQFWLMSKRFKAHRDAVEKIWKTGRSLIMDRSIYGDAVFCWQNWKSGNINDTGYQNYLQMRDVMFRYLMVPHITLFLKVDPEECNNRIMSRGRGCEKGIPIDYLQGLNEGYENLLLELKERGSHIVELDWNEFKPVDYVTSQLADKIPGHKFSEYERIM